MAIKLKVIKNNKYNSNTYLINDLLTNRFCYIIDIGNAAGVLNELQDNQEIKGIFLTHAHYDHICGINQILNKFPKCIVYCSEYTKESLGNSKINLSFYHKTPISYKGTNVKIVVEKEIINLFKGVNLEILETPGHNKGSLSFKIGDAIFSGDSLIPDTKVLTKLKTGNKTQALISVFKIKNKLTAKGLLFPGHGRSFKKSEINWEFYLPANEE